VKAKQTRRNRERERHRREILAAAQWLFARQGYEGTSMAGIAERADFAVGTLYRFFKDKNSLYRALLLEAAREFSRELEAALQTPGSELDKLERFIETKAALYVRHIPLARLYFTQGVGVKMLPASGLDREVRAIRRRTFESLEQVFRRGIRKGLLLKADAAVLVLTLQGVMNAFLELLIERPDDFPAETITHWTKTIFFERVRLKGR